jgi:hypothetical protein
VRGRFLPPGHQAWTEAAVRDDSREAIELSAGSGIHCRKIADRESGALWRPRPELR